jgi:hypothetical protein
MKLLVKSWEIWTTIFFKLQKNLTSYFVNYQDLLYGIYYCSLLLTSSVQASALARLS